jgi:hypothetical protein
VEDLPRSLYRDNIKEEHDKRSATEIQQQTPAPTIPMVLNLLPVLRDTFESPNSEAELPSFALVEPLTKHIQPNAKRSAKSMHLFSNALLKARVDSNFDIGKTLSYLAGWKSGLEFTFRLFFDAKRKTNAHFTVAT